jgi:hypothetical protein
LCPDVVDSRSRIGDWEVDLVIGKGHKGGFATLAEHKSRLYLALPLTSAVSLMALFFFIFLMSLTSKPIGLFVAISFFASIARQLSRNS